MRPKSMPPFAAFRTNEGCDVGPLYPFHESPVTGGREAEASDAKSLLPAVMVKISNLFYSISLCGGLQFNFILYSELSMC